MNHLKISRNGVIFVSLLLMVFGPATMNATYLTDSNDLDCVHVQCPDKCPDDSYLKSFLHNDDEDDDEELDDYEFETVTHISLYDDYHHLARRDVSSQHDIERCCDDQHCVCHTCPNVPQCPEEFVAIEVHKGNSTPGNCCSTYKCMLKIQCALGVKQTYWKDKCVKCSCFGDSELCEKLCPDIEEQQSCYSEYLQRPMLNGESWMEGQCTSCVCEQGDRRCVIPLQLPGCGEEDEEAVTEHVITQESDEDNDLMNSGKPSSVSTHSPSSRDKTTEETTPRGRPSSAADLEKPLVVENADKSSTTETTKYSTSTSTYTDSATSSPSPAVNAEETSKSTTRQDQSTSSSVQNETSESPTSTKALNENLTRTSEESSTSSVMFSTKTASDSHPMTSSTQEYTSDNTPDIGSSSAISIISITTENSSSTSTNTDHTANSSPSTESTSTNANVSTESSTPEAGKENSDPTYGVVIDIGGISTTTTTITDLASSSVNSLETTTSDLSSSSTVGTITSSDGGKSSVTAIEESTSTAYDGTSHKMDLVTAKAILSETSTVLTKSSTITDSTETSKSFDTSTQSADSSVGVSKNDFSTTSDPAKSTTNHEDHHTLPESEDNTSSSTLVSNSPNVVGSITPSNNFTPLIESTTTTGKISTNVPKTTTINEKTTTHDITNTSYSTESTPTESTSDTSSSTIFSTSSPYTSPSGEARFNDLAMSTTSTPSISRQSTTTAPGPLEPLFQQNHEPFDESVYPSHNQTHDNVHKLFDEIDYIVMIVLFIGALLCITLGLIIRHAKNRKKMYSSIPNSETSLSQNSTHTMMTV